MKLITHLLAVLALLFPLSISQAISVSPAQDPRPLYTVYTASQRSALYQVGLDIQRVCPALNIQVEATNGSLDNLNNLIQEPVTRAGYRFAIVQHDALNSVLNSEPRAKTLVNAVFQMFDMDITVLANRASNIKTLKDLNNKRVAVGVVGSGIWFSANRIRAALDLSWESIERSPEESILSVLTGEIDAIIVTGGTPNKLFTELSESVKNRVELINMGDVELNALYPTGRIKADMYLWQNKPAVLRKTKAIFVAASDVPASASGALTSCIMNSQDELRRTGSPYWKSMLLRK